MRRLCQPTEICVSVLHPGPIYLPIAQPTLAPSLGATYRLHKTKLASAWSGKNLAEHYHDIPQIVLPYAGVWYEYQRFPDIVGGRLDCTSYTFHNTWYAMSVIKKGTLRSSLFGNKFVLRNITALGLATTPDTDKPAEFNLVFGEEAAPGQKANYIIHDTDYKTYSVVFSCTQVENLNIQYAWILTRVRGVAPPNLPQLESKLTEAGVDVGAFFVVHQKGCPGIKL
ncbi:apolipoprotein d-like [Plakobranchus ocellatus]|uniref:Apolipoprotein d-like n=1 Tax=Plakobranchus ocellatus TaxID=259542 RepID=A0AAV4DFJ9_9GAST|nr:apolipoprotein d-like [Plakobranchus ocellatus]